jgi:hypothetical protein
VSATEWILIITMHLSSPLGQLDSIETAVIQGFTSEDTCESAKKKIALHIGGQAGRHREQQGIKANKKIRAPSLEASCLPIKK